MSLTDTRRYSHERYAKLVDDTFAEIKKLGELKGGEYSGDDDRLLNFRRNGADTGLPKETIWRVYAAKHWDAIGQYVRDIQSGKARTRLESLAGRCDDLIVYLLLFKAMLDESGPDKDERMLFDAAKDMERAKDALAAKAGFDPARRDDGGDMVLRTSGRLVPRMSEDESRLEQFKTTHGATDATSSKHERFYEIIDSMPISTRHKRFLKDTVSELPDRMLSEPPSYAKPAADPTEPANYPFPPRPADDLSKT